MKPRRRPGSGAPGGAPCGVPEGASFGRARAALAAVAEGTLLGALCVALLLPSVVASGRVSQRSAAARAAVSPADTLRNPPGGRPIARFGDFDPSADTRRVAQWAVATQDNGGAAFFIVDKKAAMLYAFDGAGRLVAGSVILIGAAVGDRSVPGIGQRPIALVQPAERTTPAGRFVAVRGHDTLGEDVVWVDYGAAVAMHRVVTTNPAEHRLQRMASPRVADRRISYGCINVPAAFYDRHVQPAFARHPALVYVLPDTESIQAAFGR